MAYETLLVEVRGRVGWLTFNRPDSMNSMDATMAEELGRAWKELDEHPDVRVIVLTGRGRGFQVGIDLAAAAAGSKIVFDETTNERRRITSRSNSVWKPVICAVNGVCAGAGFLFVNDSDIVIASSDATFFDPHVSVGQVSALEPIGLLGRIPFGSIMKMVLTGREWRMTASEAHRLGLVDQITDPGELENEAEALAAMIARNSPSAMMATKRAIWHALEMTRRDAFREAHHYISAFRTHPDQREGPRAFAGRRDPVWAAPEQTW